jgi:deoxyribodipyrimidine photo-lyase
MITQSNKRTVAIWWVKRDFRLFDNAALCRALTECDEVLPLYVFEPLVFQGPDWSEKHAQAIHEGTTSLRKNLEHHESTLVVRQGNVLTSLEELTRSHGVTHIYAHEETGLDHTFERDKQVAKWCREQNISFIEVPTNGVVRGLKNRDHWQKLFSAEIDGPLLPIPKMQLIKSLPTGVKKGRIPAASTLGYKTNNQLTEVSERAAHVLLREFLYTRGHAYSGGISSMNTAPTACSRLSIHLAWGTISLATIMRRTNERLKELKDDKTELAMCFKKSLRKFQSRLYWHSHFVQKLEDEVEMEFEPVNPVFAEGLPCVDGEEQRKRIEAWRTGQTGFPAIDAAMRCYAETGWLNFRSRAMITSFATHALRIHWHTIVYELAKLMHDYVPGINVSQVQMQAGVTGTNTIRVYSPQKQLEDQDPHCHFVKKWIPELADTPNKEIIGHQSNPVEGYLVPIIDFKAETKIMKDALYAKKKSPDGRMNAKQVYKKHGSRKRTVRK